MTRNHPRNNHGLKMMLAATCMLAGSTAWAQNTVPATQPTVPDFSHMISKAGGTWKDPITGATVECGSACLVKVVDNGGKLKVEFADGKPGNVLVSSPGRTLKLDVMGKDGSTKSSTIDQGKAGLFVLGALAGQFGEADKVTVTTGLDKVVRLDIRDRYTLNNGGKVYCTGPCLVMIGSDGNPRILPEKVGDTGFTAGVNGGKTPLDVTIETPNGPKSYRVLAGKEEAFDEYGPPGYSTSTTEVPTPAGATPPTHAQLIAAPPPALADQIKGKDIAYVLYSNSVPLPGGASLHCYGGCNAVLKPDGTVELDATQAYAPNFTVTPGNSPLRVVMKKPDGTQTQHDIPAGSVVQFMQRVIFSELSPDKTMTYHIPLSKLNYPLANGTLVSCTNPCDVVIAPDGKMRVTIPGGSSTDQVAISSADSGLDVVIDIPGFGGPRSYHVDAKKRATFALGEATNAKLVKEMVAVADGTAGVVWGNGGSTAGNGVSPGAGSALAVNLDSSSAAAANEETNADGTNRPLSQTALPAVGAWPAVVALVNVYDTVESVDASYSGTHTLSSGALASFQTLSNSGTGTTTSVCALSECGQPATIRWGKWTAGSANISATTITVNANNTLHYIIGSATSPAVIAGRSTAATFNHIGGTVPTSSDGSTYTAATGAITINFNGTATPAGTLSSYALTRTSGTGPASLTFSGVTLSVSTGAGVATVSGTNTAGTATLVVNGAFFGTGGNHIGAGMHVNDSSPAVRINSVQVFKEP